MGVVKWRTLLLLVVAETLIFGRSKVTVVSLVLSGTQLLRAC